MKMNRLESIVMRSPIRGWFLKWVEAPTLKNLGGPLTDMTVLEIGCGNGMGTKLLVDNFEAAHVTAIDIDPKMVTQAKSRLAACIPHDVQVQLGDVTSLSFPDESFDAIVNFAAIHHITDWQKAISEIRRVLKPGGKFYFEEVTSRWLTRWPYRRLFIHPTENRFSARDFISELEQQHFSLADRWLEKQKGDFVFGVGIKATACITSSRIGA